MTLHAGGGELRCRYKQDPPQASPHWVIKQEALMTLCELCHSLESASCSVRFIKITGLTD